MSKDARDVMNYKRHKPNKKQRTRISQCVWGYKNPLRLIMTWLGVLDWKNTNLQSGTCTK